MENESLGKLSSEQLQRLASVLSDAKSLMKQQEEIIEKVLEGEEDIGKLRISYLESYFGKYFDNLDLVARKCSSLNETFLVLNEQLTKSFKALNSADTESDQAESGTKPKRKRAKQDTPDAAGQRPSTGIERSAQRRPGGVDREAQDFVAAMAGLREAIKASRYGTDSASSETAATSSTGGSGSGGRPTPSVVETVSDDSRTGLNEVSLNDVFEQIDVNKIQIEAAESNNTRLKEILRAAENVHDSMLELAIARLKTEEEYTNRSVEFRLSRLKETTDAELAAQKLLNEIDTQLARNASRRGGTDKEIGDLRARKTNAEFDLKAYQELESQMADYRAKLDLEARDKNNGVLTAKQAAENEKLVRKEFASRREALLKEIKAEQLEKEKLARLEKDDPKLAQAREKQLADYIAEQEYRAKKAKRAALTKEETEAIKKQAEAKFKLDESNLERIEKIRKRQEEKDQKEREKERAKAGDRAVSDAVTGTIDKDNNLLERFKALRELTKDEEGNKIAGANLAVAVKSISTIAQQLESSIDKIAQYKGDVDTRLQGSNNKKVMGSHWDQLNRDMMSVGAVTPFFRQENFANNIRELVSKGISFDLKQRAFLMTIQEKIANTFNVADGTLLRLIRIQQEDSTAGRLGMESALNSFLNEMYETTEYLTDVAASVRGSLEEMEALMSGAAATEVEYQVQKWMGSLYSVGMSQNAVTSISNALGQIASGQVDALTNGGAGNLLVMAANDAGISIADILTDGLNAKDTNKLLQATVNYLAEIAESSKDNNVVQQQLADVFGVKASDLRAATNLVTPGTTNDIFETYKTYDNMLKQLNDMAGTMYQRTSIGEMMTNIWENGQYSISSSMANNPVSYLIYKLAGLLDDAVGGIDLPFINVMGFGVDLNTTVADLMRVASVGAGVLGSLGPMISGLASSFSGQSMLSKMGIGKGSGLQVTPRGGDGVGGGGGTGGGLVGGCTESTSGSGYVDNGS